MENLLTLWNINGFYYGSKVRLAADCGTEKAGRRMKTHNDFLELADVLENEVHEHVSESTLERVWGYSTRHYDTVSERKIGTLSSTS